MEIRVQQWSYPDLSTLEIGKKHIQFHYTHYAHICQIEYIRAAAKSPHYIKRYKRAKSDKITAIFFKNSHLKADSNTEVFHKAAQFVEKLKFDRGAVV